MNISEGGNINFVPLIYPVVRLLLWILAFLVNTETSKQKILHVNICNVIKTMMLCENSVYLY